jgi:aryl-alcohol dehydrogenase-like predicted oxidoreductase
MTTKSSVQVSDLLAAGAPRLGFGCGDLYGADSLPASIRLVEAALDAGVRWFDTARLYGNGTGETVLGAVLPRVRDKVVIVGKAGVMPWSMLRWPRFAAKAARIARSGGPLARAVVPPPAAAAERGGMFRPADLARSVDRTLKALRTDHLDVFLLHECSVREARAEETSRFLERLRTQGKARFCGISTRFPETVRILEEAPAGFAAAQFESDIFDGHARNFRHDWTGLKITHSALKRALPRLTAHFASDPAARRRWKARTGAEPDASTLARLLLGDALATNPQGVVLFSTSRPDRLAEAARATGCDADLLAALREETALADPAPAAV